VAGAVRSYGSCRTTRKYDWSAGCLISWTQLKKYDRTGVIDMDKGKTDTVQKGLRRVKEAEQLLLDLEQMSRQGTPDERRVAKKLLEEYFPDY